jgi:hypothetical protein
MSQTDRKVSNRKQEVARPCAKTCLSKKKLFNFDVRDDAERRNVMREISKIAKVQNPTTGF